MQYIKLKFGWVFGATGPEVQADTLYWNDGEFSVLIENSRALLTRVVEANY